MFKKLSVIFVFILSIIISFILSSHIYGSVSTLSKFYISSDNEKAYEPKKDFIKWVDFNVSLEALNKAYDYDISTINSDVHLNWIELLAYTGAVCGGNFNLTSLEVMDSLADTLMSKENTLLQLTRNLKYYDYYYEAYSGILSEYVGEYKIKPKNISGSENDASLETRYGLKVFSPIAKGFDYSDYDDFGATRSYGYKRQHLGHDMMGLVGTPIIAVESGYVEALGWNQYGGWRIGIRSFDKKRYYYYAHLRQNYPFAKGLKEGDSVKAGEVIGYMGHTGYSTRENVNNIDSTHLHFGIQLIFDESQKECNSEIWIDCYNLVRFLSKNRSEVARDASTKEWYSVNEYEASN